jgi:hypothetical protein
VTAVVEIDLGITWDPNATEPLLVQTGEDALLVVHPDMNRDRDRRLVTFHWFGCYGASLSGPNDEARAGHPLWSTGLSDCLWAGEVVESDWIAHLERQNSVHDRHDPSRFADLRHLILLLKENTFEVVCRRWEISRMEPAHDLVRAASAALHG